MAQETIKTRELTIREKIEGNTYHPIKYKVTDQNGNKTKLNILIKGTDNKYKKNLDLFTIGKTYSIPVGTNKYGLTINNDTDLNKIKVVSNGASNKTEKIKTDRGETIQGHNLDFDPTEIFNDEPEEEYQGEIIAADAADESNRFDLPAAVDTTEPNTQLKNVNEFGLPPIPVMEEQIKRLTWLKKSLVSKSDFQKINGNDYLTKSGWRKIAQGFGLSFNRTEFELTKINGVEIAKATVTVIDPNGRYSTGTGFCSRDEPGKSKIKIHDLFTTAETRARNRAISDLVAFGEVSAEEVK